MLITVSTVVIRYNQQCLFNEVTCFTISPRNTLLYLGGWPFVTTGSIQRSLIKMQYIDSAVPVTSG